MRVWRFLALVFVGALGASGTRLDSRMMNPDTSAADILWLPADAVLGADFARPVAYKNGRSIYIDGSGGVTFTLTGDREKLTNRLIQHFADEDWNRRATQYSNPKMPTSFDEGWRTHCACMSLTGWQGDSGSHEPFRDWQGEWENSRGNIVMYHLAADGWRLRGHAAFIPLAVVEATRRKLGL
jgi:hypothetical protein